MKAFITPAYTFTPGASGVGTIDLSGITSFDIKRLIAVINQTDGVLIYSTANVSKRYTSVVGNVVTLFADTSTMDASDVLQVVYEAEDTHATSAKQDLEKAVLDNILTKLNASLAVTGTFYQATQPVSGTVSVGNFPASQATTSTPAVLAGGLTHTQKTVGTLAVRATVDGNAPNASRKKLFIKPSANNSGKIFLGSSSVTTANGLEIIGPDRLEFEFDSADYYLISDTAGQVVEILEKA